MTTGIIHSSLLIINLAILSPLKNYRILILKRYSTYFIECMVKVNKTYTSWLLFVSNYAKFRNELVKLLHLQGWLALL